MDNNIKIFTIAASAEYLFMVDQHGNIWRRLASAIDDYWTQIKPPKLEGQVPQYREALRPIA